MKPLLSVVALILLAVITDARAGFSEGAAADNVSTFGGLHGSVSAAHLIKADNDQAISKVNERNISRFEFYLAERRRFFYIAACGIGVAFLGALLGHSNRIADSWANALVIAGVIITLASPYIVLLWSFAYHWHYQ